MHLEVGLMKDIAELKRRAKTYYKSGEFNSALKLCKELVALEPGVAKNWLKAATCLKELGRFEEALACSEEAISLSPEMAVAYTWKSIALRELGQMDRAIAALSQSLSLGPTKENFAGRGVMRMDRAMDELGVCATLLQEGLLEQAEAHEARAANGLRAAVSDFKSAASMGWNDDGMIEYLLRTIEDLERVELPVEPRSAFTRPAR